MMIPGWPSMAIQEDGSLTFSESLPGRASGDLTISIDRNVLTITGRPAPGDGAPEAATASETRGPCFCRSFVLPSCIDVSRVRAKWSDDQLEVVIPAPGS